MLWYSLEAPHRGASNEYHNVYFLRYKKISNHFRLKTCALSGAFIYIYIYIYMYVYVYVFIQYMCIIEPVMRDMYSG